MGDRVWCEIHIHRADYEYLKQKLNMDQGALTEHFDVMEIEKGKELVTFRDDQANYGNIEILEHTLQEEKIEYDKNWEAGGDFSKGESHYRRVKNKYLENEIYEPAFDLLDFVNKLRKIKDSKKIKVAVNSIYKHLMPFEIKKLKPKEVPKWGKGKDALKL